MLKLSGNFGSLEGTDESIEKSVVGRIKAVKNGFWKSIFAVKGIKKLRQRFGTVFRSDAVKTGIGADFFKHFAVRVAKAVVMNLHYPAKADIFFRTENEKSSFEHRCFLCGNFFVLKTFFYDFIKFTFGARFKNHVVKPMVAGFAAMLVKIFDSFAKGFFERIKIAY